MAIAPYETPAVDSIERPAARRNGWFYYGWINVAIAAIAMSATFPGRTYGLGLIKEPLRANLELTDLGFNLLNFWAIVIGAVVVLPVGRLIDRIGSRLTLGLVAGTLGASVLAMSAVAEIWQLAVALTFVRGLGQGALSIVAIALVGKWFRRRAGTAMAVFTFLLAFGFLVPIGAVGWAVEAYGWRVAWQGVGLTLLLFVVPIGLIFARSTPESIGVEPDDPAPEEGRAEPMTLGATLKTPAFWVYTAASTVFNLTFSALTLDSALLLKEHGLEQGSANSIVLGLLMLAGLPANLIVGYLSRFVPLGRLLGAGALILAASLAFFPFVSDLVGAAIYGTLLGVAGGAITVVYFAVYGHTYGRTHLGSIQAVVQILSVFASATGPVVLAAVRTWNGGDTTPYFAGFATLTAALAVAAWLVKPPVRTPEVEGA